MTLNKYIAIFLAVSLQSCEASADTPDWVKRENGLYKCYLNDLIDNKAISNPNEIRLLKRLAENGFVPSPIFFLGYIQKIDNLLADMKDPTAAPTATTDTYADEGMPRAEAWRMKLLNSFEDVIDKRRVRLYVFARKKHFWAYSLGGQMWTYTVAGGTCVILTDYKTEDLLAWTHHEQDEAPEKVTYSAPKHQLHFSEEIPNPHMEVGGNEAPEILIDQAYSVSLSKIDPLITK